MSYEDDHWFACVGLPYFTLATTRSRPGVAALLQ
jgi:hypothetical protein